MTDQPPPPATVEEIRALAEGLLDIAALAMPTTFYATDSRCELARTILARFDGEG